MKIFHFAIPLALLSIFILISISSCDIIDSEWHKYQDQNSELYGKRKDEFKVLSHGWKIIGKHEDDAAIYDWGWELTLSLEKIADEKRYSLGVNDIEYTLFDKDNFELIKMKLDGDERIILDVGRKKGPFLIEAGDTKTFRQTSTISKQKAKRAEYGICKIILENN